MENNIQHIELSRLAAVLESALDATTKTRIALHKCCDIAQHLLHNWPIPNSTVHEDPPHCTCDVNDEDSAVARNIEQVVRRAQKVRGTSSAAQLQPNSLPLTKKSSLEKPTLACGLGSKKQNDKVHNKTQSPKLNSVNSPQSSGLQSSNSVSKTSLLDSCSPRTTQTNIHHQSLPIPIVSGNHTKKATIKQRSKSSSSLQSTYQKDFSARTNHTIAKHNIEKHSNLKPKKSLLNDKITDMLCSKNSDSVKVSMYRNPGRSSRTSFQEEIGVSDLEDLLSRVSVYSNVTADLGTTKKRTPDVKVNSRLSYNDNIADNTKNAYKVVGLPEAVDVLGVPSDLVAVLRTYHHLLAENKEGRMHGCHARKRQPAAESFLTKLSAMNNASWQQFAHEPLVGLFSEYRALLSEVSSAAKCKFKDITDETLACLQHKLELLEKKHYKWSDVDESTFTQLKTRNCNGITEEKKCSTSYDGYAMTGIWNLNSIGRFKALAEMQYIRYSSEGQWKKFEANVQEIQMLELQTEVLEVIESSVLPQLITYDTQDPTFAKLYKTVCSLCNITMLTSPIIIKSC